MLYMLLQINKLKLAIEIAEHRASKTKNNILFITIVFFLRFSWCRFRKSDGFFPKFWPASKIVSGLKITKASVWQILAFLGFRHPCPFYKPLGFFKQCAHLNTQSQSPASLLFPQQPLVAVGNTVLQKTPTLCIWNEMWNNDKMQTASIFFSVAPGKLAHTGCSGIDQKGLASN